MENFRRCILTTFLVAPLVLAIGQSVPPGLLQGVFAQSQEAKKIGMEPSKQMKRVIARLRTAYAAFNRGDFDSAVKPLDPQIEWTEPAEFPGGGTYHGRDAVRGYLQQSRSGWTEGSSEPERFIVADDHIVVFVYAHFRPKGSNEWQGVRLADVYTVHHGKVVRMNAFADRQQALNWAGVKIEG